MKPALEDVLARVRELAAAHDREGLALYLEPLHPADVADVLEELGNGERVFVLKTLGTEKAAEVLTEVDERSGQALLQLLTDHEVVSLLEEMPSDDAADIMAGLPPAKSKEIHKLLATDDREMLQELLGFEEDTAGGIMEAETAAVSEDSTIADAISLVRSKAEEIENMQNVYVLDRAGRVRGKVPILDLLLHDAGEKVLDVMQENVITVPVDMDQEQVASLFGKYDQFTLPVVDRDGRLVGRITADDILDVVEEEATEDIARIAGTDEEEIGETSPLKISRARLPWLIVSVIGEALNAVVMSRFTLSIETMVALVFFIPLLLNTAGSTGVQAAVVVVREIAVGHDSVGRVWRRVFRELQVALLNDLVLGIILFAVVTAWQGEIGLGLLLWVTLICVTCVSAFLGAIVPLTMHRMKIDPAIAAGPFITVSSDVVGLLIYMVIATNYIAIFHKG
jgi:magnesium transporter